jgi:hypothetical protein
MTTYVTKKGRAKGFGDHQPEMVALCHQKGHDDAASPERKIVP